MQACQTGFPTCWVNLENRKSLGSSATWLGLSKLLLPSRARARICAQLQHGAICLEQRLGSCGRESKTRTELIFPFRNNFNYPKPVWKLLMLGKKETAAKQGFCCTFVRSYRALGLRPASPKPAAGESTLKVSNAPLF